MVRQTFDIAIVTNLGRDAYTFSAKAHVMSPCFNKVMTALMIDARPIMIGVEIRWLRVSRPACICMVHC